MPTQKIKKTGGSIRFKGIFSKLKKVLGLSIIVILIFLLLSGVINQVKTGQTIVEWALNIGEAIGDTIVSVFSGDGPIVVDENGIYFKDVEVPENSALE